MIFSNRRLNFHADNGVSGLRFAQRRGGEVFVISADRSRTGFSVWDGSNGQLVWEAADIFPPALGIATVGLPDGRAVLAASEEYTMTIWDLLTGQEIATDYDADTVWDLKSCVLPCGNTVLIGAGNSGAVLRWVAGTGESYGRPIVGHEAAVRSIATFELPGEGLVIVSGDELGVIRRWNAASGDPIGDPIVGPQSHIWHLAVASANCNNIVLVAGTADGWMIRWDAISGDPIGEKIFLGSESTTAVCAVTAGGSSAILTADSDERIRQWDPRFGREVGVSIAGRSVATMHVGDGSALVATGTKAGDISVRQVLQG